MRSDVARLPASPGVYRFRDAGGRVLYIGRATALRSRVASYWLNLGDRPHLARMVRNVTRIEAVACQSVHEAAWFERNLLEERMPRWNRTPGGAETPGYLLLDATARTPGLRMVHRAVPGVPGGDLPGGGPHPAAASPGTPPPGQLFGPYLGGTKIRQALSGLRRVYPLAYAGDRLTSAERDMAAKLGVRTADRESLVAALMAVLRREPAAVAHARGELERSRDRAAAELAFERAGRVQDEIRALEWITAPQRATTRDGGDGEVHGWADGVLVSFTIRGGRLCEWTQRRCSRPAAAQRLAASPPAWAAFAQHNADLAATLGDGSPAHDT